MRPAGAPHPDAAYVRLVQGIGLRVSIVGTRGKATLAGLVAAALQRRGMSVHCNAPRAERPAAEPGLVAAVAAAAGLAPEDRQLVAQERAAVSQAFPVQALVLANHARAAAGQRALHAQVCLPHYVLVTNVRRDPVGLVAPPLATVARRIVQSITPGATVLSGEADPALKAVLRRECERRGLPFVDASPRRAHVPAAELVSLLQGLLLHRFGKAFEPEEEAGIRRDLEGRFRWAPSSIPGVRWFHAGPIHDVDSTQIVLNHLQAQRRSPVTFVVYLRADRPGRTRAYLPFLEELLAAPDTRQVVLCGHRAQAIADRLDRWGSQVRVVRDEPGSIPRLLRRLQFDCQGGAIVTLCNGSPEWPRELARHLQRPAPTPMARPPRPEPSAVPRRIARPMVAPVAVRGVAVPQGLPDASLPGAPGPGPAAVGPVVAASAAPPLVAPALAAPAPTAPVPPPPLPPPSPLARAAAVAATAGVAVPPLAAGLAGRPAVPKAEPAR